MKWGALNGPELHRGCCIPPEQEVLLRQRPSVSPRTWGGPLGHGGGGSGARRAASMAGPAAHPPRIIPVEGLRLVQLREIFPLRG
eukprot:1178051-Prorocentrum_minimum.AAC.11